MTQFVIRVDGDRGELFVDGERAELFGALVGVNVRRDVTRPLDLRSHVALEMPVVEVTLRLPLRSSDTLTVLRDTNIEDLRGPTVDGEDDGLSKTRTVLPAEAYDKLMADLKELPEPNNRVREAARKLRDAVRREDVADRERIVHENPELAQRIREGVEEAETGRTVYLGSFAQHLDEDEREPEA